MQPSSFISHLLLLIHNTTWMNEKEEKPLWHFFFFEYPFSLAQKNPKIPPYRTTLQAFSQIKKKSRIKCAHKQKELMKELIIYVTPQGPRFIYPLPVHMTTCIQKVGCQSIPNGISRSTWQACEGRVSFVVARVDTGGAHVPPQTYIPFIIIALHLLINTILILNK